MKIKYGLKPPHLGSRDACTIQIFFENASIQWTILLEHFQYCKVTDFSNPGLILQLIEKHGYEAERHLFRCLFSFIDFAGDGKNNGKDFLQVIIIKIKWLGSWTINICLRLETLFM